MFLNFGNKRKRTQDMKQIDPDIASSSGFRRKFIINSHDRQTYLSEKSRQRPKYTPNRIQFIIS